MTSEQGSLSCSQQSLPTYLFKIQINIILPFTARSFKWSLPFKFLKLKFSIHFSSFACMLNSLPILSLIWLFWWYLVKSTNYALFTHFSPSSCHFLLLTSTVFSATLLNLCCSFESETLCVIPIHNWRQYINIILHKYYQYHFHHYHQNYLQNSISYL
jgi:hypothetical protein